MKSLMDKYTIINLKRNGISNRETARITGADRKTVARYWKEYQEEVNSIREKETTGDDIRQIQEEIISGMRYDSSSRTPRKFTPEVEALLDEILASEDEKDSVLGSNKQKLTHGQIHEMITDAGHEIGRTTLSTYIRKKREEKKEAFIKQEYELGDRLEYDFGDVKLVIDGTVGTYHMAVLAAPASGYRWAYLYDNMKKEVFLDSHVRYFEMIGGVHKELVYDNMKNVVTRFIGRGEKQLNSDLIKMSLYYGFRINVTNCFSGNEKGFVESSVKKLQRQVFAKEYRFNTLEEAEKYLHIKLEELNKDSLIEKEKEHLLEYMPPLELARITAQKVDKYSFIQVENNYYSVPEHLVGHWVKAKIYLRDIQIYSDNRLVASHKKADGYHVAQVDIYHYLETLEKKPGALKNSKALKSKAELKTIYDKYFTTRTKEFIEILRTQADKSYPQLVEVLRQRGKESPAYSSEKASEITDNVANKTRQQLKAIASMYTSGGAGHVN